MATTPITVSGHAWAFAQRNFAKSMTCSASTLAWLVLNDCSKTGRWRWCTVAVTTTRLIRISPPPPIGTPVPPTPVNPMAGWVGWPMPSTHSSPPTFWSTSTNVNHWRCVRPAMCRWCLTIPNDLVAKVCTKAATCWTKVRGTALTPATLRCSFWKT